MDLIFQSNHAPMLKLSLLAAWKASMVEIGNDIAYRDADKTELGTRVAAVILGWAAAGQTSPGQLQRHAVTQAKADARAPSKRLLRLPDERQWSFLAGR